MPTEPLTCSACSRKFSPRFARCPFCNALAAAPEARERCTSCGRERAPDITACPFCHPDRVAARPAGTAGSAAPAAPRDVEAIRRAFEAGAAAERLHDKPLLDRRLLLGSALATGVGLVGALACAHHYDRIGPDAIGTMARAGGLLVLAYVGILFRRSMLWGNAMSWERLRAIIPPLVLVALPVSLCLYTLLLLLNGWTSDTPQDVTCTLTSYEGRSAKIDCQLPSGRARALVRGAPLRERLADARTFVAPARRGGLSVWLLDLEGATPADATQRPTGPLRERPFLSPSSFGGVIDDGRGPPHRAPSPLP